MKAIFTTIAAIVLATTVMAQNGKMKFSGLIQDDKNETQLTMISLYNINSGSGDTKMLIGQDVVEGNNWFDVTMELGKKYEMIIISNNGQERVLAIDTNTPNTIDKNKFRHAIKVDMTGADLDITHSFLNNSESAGAYNNSVHIGELAYDEKAEAFIHDEYAIAGMPLAASK